VKTEPFEVPSVVYWIEEIVYERVYNVYWIGSRLNSDPSKESQSPFLYDLASFSEII
jgi:hypothetical protein